MSGTEDLETMVERIVEGEPKTVARKIQIYSAGAAAKLRNAEYSLQRLKDLAEKTDSGTSTDADAFQVSDKVHFYVDSFFAFLYSTLDVMSQVTNQKMRLAIDERRVSFKGVKKTLDQQHNGTAIQQAYDQIERSRFFKNLDKFRNCSTHRRQIFIRLEEVKVSETPGYSTTGEVCTIQRFLCDDPLTLNPAVKQKRELISYCSMMLDKADQSISSIANAV